ncbi:MAG TPA: hypothetical protein PLH86_11240, partial [Saprospiraceae bacterium]|nr:hypothetical protein [Saprospiraceae bacterium]
MGKLVEIKTKANESSVSDFLNAILDEEKRKNSYDILQLMEKVTKEKAKLWGKSLIGFGQYRYKSPATG